VRRANVSATAQASLLSGSVPSHPHLAQIAHDFKTQIKATIAAKQFRNTNKLNKF